MGLRFADVLYGSDRASDHQDHHDHHGVSIPELKMSTNLKMHLKPSVQDVWQNGKSGSTL